MRIVNGEQTSRKIKSIVDFEFDNYILSIFPGSLSQFDILIKYKKGDKRFRTPKHIHWVVDLLLKMQHEMDLTQEFLKNIKVVWEECLPLQNREFYNIKNIVENGIKNFNIEKFNTLDSYGEYPIDFLYVLMLLLSIQEKTNRSDAYMFGQIIDEMLEIELDIFSIMSRAGFGGIR